jgi:hypothetical protein
MYGSIRQLICLLRITHFSETIKDRNLIFDMGGDANAFNIFYSRGSAPPAGESVLKNVTEIPTLNHIYL